MKRWVVGVTLLLTFVLALSPWLPYLERVWEVEGQREFLPLLATLVGLQFAILTTALTLILLDQGNEAGKSRDELLERLNGPKIHLLRDKAFYSQFIAAAAHAKHRVDISYFAPHPPDWVKRPYRDQYYRGILDTIRDNRDAHFRRIVRSTPSNEAWVAGLVRELHGLANAHISMLEDRPDNEPMGLALSVQIVDNADVWLVALRSHEIGEFRDVHVQHVGFAQMAEGYFMRLWGSAVSILENGRITEAGEALLERVAADGE